MKFELFGRLKKHSTPEPRPQAREIPYERVEQLAAQGMSEADIIKTLKDTGYSFREIDEALNGAVKAGIGTPDASATLHRRMNPELPDNAADNFALLTPEPEPHDDSGNLADEAPSVNADELEEIINAVTNEKMSDVRSAVEKSELAVKDITEKLKGINASIESAKSHEVETNAEADRKLGELRAKIDELEPKILGLERAFKDIMPNLVDSVREVKEAMHSMRAKQPVHNREAERDEDERDSFDDIEGEIKEKESGGRHEAQGGELHANKPAFRLPRQKPANI